MVAAPSTFNELLSVASPATIKVLLNTAWPVIVACPATCNVPVGFEIDTGPVTAKPPIMKTTE